MTHEGRASQAAVPDISGSRNLTAVAYMGASVVAASFVPLVVSRSGGAEAPFLFNSLLRVGVSAGSLIFLLLIFRHTLFDSQNLSVVRDHVLAWKHNKFLILAVITNLNYVMFAWSVKFLDIAVSSVLFDTWPTLVIFLTAWLFRKSGRYRPLSKYMVFLTSVSLVGFLFGLLSQNPGGGGVGGTLTGSTLIGGGLVALGVLSSAFLAFGIKWGADLGSELVARDRCRSLELFGAVFAFLTASSISGVINGAIGLGIGESFSFSRDVAFALGLTLPAFAVAILGGVFAQALGGILYRHANFLTNTCGINSVVYATPVLSLCWLYAFGEANVARFDYLAIGATAIIVSNVLINFEGKICWGFRAIISSTAISGSKASSK